MTITNIYSISLKSNRFQLILNLLILNKKRDTNNEYFFKTYQLLFGI